MVWRVGLLGLALSATGCFVDQPTAIDRVCPAGNETCKCLPAEECSEGLVCDSGVCRNPRCVDGQLGCACSNGSVCEDGLECIDASCLSPDDSSSGTMTSGNASTSNVSTTNVSTSAGPGPDVTSEAEVGPGTIGSEESGDPPTTGVDTGVMPPAGCHCGWDPDSNYFGCGWETDAEFPGAPCPKGMDVAYEMHMMGDTVPCDIVEPALTFVGCCLGEAINPYCAGETIQWDECTDDHFACMDGPEPA